jgi:hypothetical protein
MSLRNKFGTLSRQEKILLLCFLERGMCLAVRDVPTKDGEQPAARLEKCDAFIEITHRVMEQMAHYLRDDGNQRPDADVFDLLDELCTKVGLPKVPEFAWRYAEKGLAATPNGTLCRPNSKKPLRARMALPPSITRTVALRQGLVARRHGVPQPW